MIGDCMGKQDQRYNSEVVSCRKMVDCKSRLPSEPHLSNVSDTNIETSLRSYWVGMVNPTSAIRSHCPQDPLKLPNYQFYCEFSTPFRRKRTMDSFFLNFSPKFAILLLSVLELALILIVWPEKKSKRVVFQVIISLLDNWNTTLSNIYFLHMV